MESGNKLPIQWKARATLHTGRLHGVQGAHEVAAAYVILRPEVLLRIWLDNIH